VFDLDVDDVEEIKDLLVSFMDAIISGAIQSYKNGLIELADDEFLKVVKDLLKKRLELIKFIYDEAKNLGFSHEDSLNLALSLTKVIDADYVMDRLREMFSRLQEVSVKQ